MMDYEKKYKEALERAKEFVSRDNVEVAEYIFPELAESEDEKMRKYILSHFQEHLNKVQEFISEGMSPPFSGYELKMLEASVAWLKKQGEQKPADKVEPKFKVKKGGWYVCTNTFVSKGKIIAIKGQTYQSKQEDDTITCEDDCLFIDRHDGKVSDYFRLWTIQDAKDGDVLAVEPIEGYSSSFVAIYKKQNEEDFDSYCFVGFDGKFYDGENGHSAENIHPATQEQRDTLMIAMSDAGYTFDFEKKELKKIEVESAWSEEDEKMLDTVIEDIVKLAGPYVCYHKDVDWLKSLKDRVQPKVELTQLDKNILEAAIAFVEQNNHFNCWGGVDKHTVLSALHSLRHHC